jgi:hypothetical protein
VEAHNDAGVTRRGHPFFDSATTAVSWMLSRTPEKPVFLLSSELLIYSIVSM